MKKLEAALEAALFAAGEPVGIKTLSEALEVETEELLELAQGLAERYISDGHGIRLVRLEDRLQLCSAPEYAQTVERVTEQAKTAVLTKVQREVLAIIAYCQPVTRAYIEQLRGAGSARSISVLLTNGLVEQCGRLDVPGRPMQYRTTENFLRITGISSLSELPELPDGQEVLE